MGMLKTISQAWKVAEIRSKMIFTLLMLVVFSLPVLPGLTLTDRGMIDGMTQRFVSMWGGGAA